MANELGWDEPLPPAYKLGMSTRQTMSDSDRIQQYEHQISRINKHRSAGSRDMGDKAENGLTRSRDSREDRGTIYCRAVDMDCDNTLDIPTFPKTDEETKFLQAAVADNFIFMEMTDTESSQLIGAMQPESFTAGAKIIQQGDIGDFFYIVEAGTVDYYLEKNGKSEVVGNCPAGGSFGELALLYCSRRAVTCVASAPVVKLWKVDQKTFRHLMAHQEHNHQSAMTDLIRKISIFKDLDSSIVSRFVKALTPVHWKKGMRIVHKGEEGSVFYIIQSGNVRVHDIGVGDSRLDELVLGPAEWFGERALLTGEPRAANVTALNDVTTMAMDRETFEAAIGPLQSLMEREIRKQSLKVIPIFAGGKVSDPEVEVLADLMTEICYRSGERLAETGQPYQMKLWVIRSGRLIVYSEKHDKLYNLQNGNYFGDKSLGGDPEHVSSYTATCEDNLTTWVLTRDQIESVIGDIERLGESEDFLKKKQDQSIQLHDLKRHGMLGQGAFGRVWLVSYDKSVAGIMTTTAYALKAISKAKIIESKLEKSVLREKELLNLLEHPFILSLVASYQDATSLYLLLPLVLGGELFSLLRKKQNDTQGMENNMAAFYAACVVEALGHFSLRRIAYRDLKLENVLVDEEGYGKIIDLGFAKVVNDKTYTLCGTPEMLAPEIIMSKGHDGAVDYWAFGVVVYELLVGHSPFYVRGSSQIEMFKRIVLVKYDVPTYVSESAKSMIAQLLVRKQSNRLGNLANGHLDIKQQPWFEESDIVFKQLFKKEVEAPWIPEIKDPFDASNFDDQSSFENEQDIGRQLSREEHELFQGF